MQALLGGPRAALDPDELAAALSLDYGAKVRHGVDVLDLADNYTGLALPVDSTGGEVTYDFRTPDRVTGQSADVTAVRRQATFQINASAQVNLYASRMRVWTDWLLPSGTWARFYLGVFMVVNPGALSDDEIRVTRKLQLADKTYLWSQQSLTEPVPVAAGTVIVDWIRTSLGARFGETRFALPGSAVTLAQARVFETGTSWLEVYNALLEAGGYDQLTTNEVGAPTTVLLSDLAGRGVEQEYGAKLKGKVLTAGEVDALLPSLPNVVRFSARQGPSLGNIEGNGLRTVKNQATGPASINSRNGLEVELRVDVDADTQTVLDAIAAADAQRYFAGGGLRWSGSVGLNPLHSDRDVIGLSLPRLGLGSAADAWCVTSWRYPLENMTSPQHALMKVTAERRVA
jgi:hypothetical protein